MEIITLKRNNYHVHDYDNDNDDNDNNNAPDTGKLDHLQNLNIGTKNLPSPVHCKNILTLASFASKHE